MDNKVERGQYRNQDNSQNPVLKRKVKEQQQRILAAAGKIPSDLIFKNAGIVNVFTGEIEYADIAVYDGIIAGIGNYACLEYNRENEVPEIVDCSDRIICPGFIDGHIHIESSMLSPAEFAAVVVPHGTTAVITDPHEIVNVAGLSGLEYMLKASKQLPLDVFIMLPSCVPATSLDESGAVVNAGDLADYMEHDRILGLAELMDYYGTVEAREDIADKIILTKDHKKRIDGHAPGLRSYGLNAYITAGVTSDHECSDASEALEKLRRGQWIMIREGTAARNMEALMPLFEKPYSGRCMLVTDDKHPGDLLRQGHMDYLIKKAIGNGADPILAIQMATINAAQYFGLTGRGALAPGYQADLVILDNLKTMTVEAVYKEGKLAALKGEYRTIKTDHNMHLNHDSQTGVYNSFHLKELVPEDFTISGSGRFIRVIELVAGELLTKELILPNTGQGFSSGREGIYKDIIKLAVVERHQNTGNIGLGYLKGYGLESGAIASSIAHDSHNLMIAGTNNDDMCLAANLVRKNQGGLAIVQDGKIVGELILPIAGLMCEESAGVVDRVLDLLKSEARRLGVKDGIDPFMTLAFLSLPVIPEIRLTTKGLADVKNQEIIKTLF
ncbi:MAG: adenine deaminase [Anaerocolumna sp.]